MRRFQEFELSPLADKELERIAAGAVDATDSSTDAINLAAAGVVVHELIDGARPRPGEWAVRLSDGTVAGIADVDHLIVSVVYREGRFVESDPYEVAQAAARAGMVVGAYGRVPDGLLT